MQEGLDGLRDAALYALGLFLRTSAGRGYPFSTYATWLWDRGFRGIERLDLPRKPAPNVIGARRTWASCVVLDNPAWRLTSAW
ncbi:MAG TPA: hypothetical protein VFL91_13150 [Thermomicrobiales bacterium]|nr:hypothetical protein [Thermomicrobiales bacterium]